MEEEQKEGEGIKAPKEENLSEETPVTETPVETPTGEMSPEAPKEEAPPETQQEVKEPQIETQEIPPTTPTPQPPLLRQLWQKALEKIKERKSKRLEKILQLASKKGEITNDDVEKLLHVSDRAASRYLNELVKQGRLKRIGSPSHAKYQLP
jgi:predicted HTH transcriptional regulator